MRDLASEEHIDATLQLAVDLATTNVGGCDLADIMFIRAGGLTTPVSSERLAVELDRIQDDTDEGPCLLAGREDTVVVADDLAAQCAAALAAAIAREGLQAALESRDVIGQAKGILMQRHRWSANEAFDQIRAVSQRRNVKVRVVAEHVADTGELP